MIGRSGIIQPVDNRPSTICHVVHHDHVHLTADFPEMLLTYWSRDRRILHLSHHVHDHSGVVLEVDEDALLPVPRLPLTDHHRGHHLLPEHRLALLHEAHTHDVKPRLCDLVQAASDALHGDDGKVLFYRVVRTIHDAHSDAHLELDFVLVLVLDLVLSESLPAVGYALLTSCRSALSRSGCSFLPAVGPLFSSAEVSFSAAVSFCLFSTVRTCVRSPASPLASAELTLPVQCEASVTSRTWLSTC